MARRLSVVMLPSVTQNANSRSYRPDEGEDPFALSRLLAERGIDLTIIDPYRRPRNPFFGLHPMLQSLDPWRAVRVLLRERKADLVMSTMEGGAASLILLRRLFGFRVPIVMHDIAPAEAWLTRKYLQDFVVPRLDGLMVLSSAHTTYVACRWSPKLRVMRVGHMVDTNFFRPMHWPENRTPGDHGLGDHSLGDHSLGDHSLGDRSLGDYAVAVGEDRGRDYPTLLQAASDLPFRLRVRTSRQLPSEAEHMDHVEVMRQRLSPVEFRELYARSRFVVAPLIPTRNASGISTILEAGAMGKALVVSDNPAIREYVVPDKTGLVVPCGDVAALRDAMRRLHDDPDLCLYLGRNAREFMVRECSPPAFANRLAATIGELVGRG